MRRFGTCKDTSIDPKLQRRQLDLIQSMNKSHLQDLSTDQNMEGMIESFELAFRMQAEAPSVLDISKESKATLDLYGIGGESDGQLRPAVFARTPLGGSRCAIRTNYRRRMGPPRSDS